MPHLLHLSKAGIPLSRPARDFEIFELAGGIGTRTEPALSEVEGSVRATRAFPEAALQVAWVGARREEKYVFSFPVHRKFRPSTVFTQRSRSLPLR
ncbi:hypothetical protein SBA2_1190001 [Acidobacteriia bacterium SbA2]|nr:hypothetical protein SBA2_1190001 [Acidobacteriia bacterium SbA2]